MGADITTLLTLHIYGADMMDTLDRTMILFYLGERTKANMYVVKATVEMIYLMVYGFMDAFPVGITVCTPDASIAGPRRAATTFTLTRRGTSGGCNLALTSRDPRACIPVAAPQAIAKGNLNGGCNLALTSRLPRA